MYNIGIDFSIFNRLIAVEFDIYQRDRSGLLADRYMVLFPIRSVPSCHRKT